MEIEIALKSDALNIAKIHKTEIKNGFLSSLPISFLEKLYVVIITSGIGFCVIAKKDNMGVGFITGVININKLYIYFLKRYFFQSFFILLPKMFSLLFLKK